ncbi:MAG: DUF3107 domain-containing protein [Candidatus Nanopelagicales bacterium]
MEVRIGIQDSPREVVFESAAEPEDLADVISEAWAANELVTLEDVKGRRILVPTDKVAYIELGAPLAGRVGFGAT